MFEPIGIADSALKVMPPSCGRPEMMDGEPTLKMGSSCQSPSALLAEAHCVLPRGPRSERIAAHLLGGVRAAQQRSRLLE